MEIITKEYLEYGKGRPDRPFLECDIPIWEEFANGLIHRGGWATNNNFSGVRSIMCGVQGSNALKEIFIVTNSKKSSDFFSYIKRSRIEDIGTMYEYLNIHETERMGKKVYIFEFVYKRWLNKR